MWFLIKKILVQGERELTNFSQIAYWNRSLVHRKALPKQCEYGIALELNSYWRILLFIGQVVCYIHFLFTSSLQFSSLKWIAMKTSKKHLELEYGQKFRNF